jgi:hypothetical protein
VINHKACSFVVPQTSTLAEKPLQTSGRSDEPNIIHRLSSLSCTQRTPAGLPSGIPGMGVVIEGAIQHAPHPSRQSIMILVKRYSRLYQSNAIVNHFFNSLDVISKQKLFATKTQINSIKIA